jgi:CRISPR-associated endoribonuclease Cas6
MRIKISYENASRDDFILPMHYNPVIQALIYSTFSPKFANLVHNIGYAYEKRNFKLFTFSRILEKGEKVVGGLVFRKGISFFFSSPLMEIMENFGVNAFKSMKFNVVGQEVAVSGIEVLSQPVITTPILIKMLSPITMHSTLSKGDGTRKAYYYEPNESDFSRMIEENARKKYFLVFGHREDNLTLNIRPYRFSVKENLSVVKFKGTPIESYTGVFELSGSPELIKITYEAGLGDRSSEGFGMWEEWGR